MRLQIITRRRFQREGELEGKSEDCRLWFTAKVRPAELPTGQESVTEHYRLELKR